MKFLISELGQEWFEVQISENMSVREIRQVLFNINEQEATLYEASVDSGSGTVSLKFLQEHN